MRRVAGPLPPRKDPGGPMALVAATKMSRFTPKIRGIFDRLLSDLFFASREVIGALGQVPTQREKRTAPRFADRPSGRRSEEHTSELQSLMRISYAVFCL